MDYGKIIKCTEKANFYGRMEEGIKVVTQKIKNMVKENSIGLTEENIKVNG